MSTVNKEAGDVEQVTPYNDNRAKSGQVEDMFNAIASAYDIMNTAMTFGLHRYWRNRALALVEKTSPQSVLDVATGTGDVAFHLYKRCKPQRLIGLDISDGMLNIARRKLAESKDAEMQKAIDFVHGDSLSLPFENNSFDAVTVAYGVRNFEHLEEGLRQMARVLRPGGILCIIELSEPRHPLTHAAYKIYSRKLIPFIGRMVSGDDRAYTYLPESIAAAPQREDLTRIMANAGLTDCKFKSLTFGAVTIYTATKK